MKNENAILWDCVFVLICERQKENLPRRERFNALRSSVLSRRHLDVIDGAGNNDTQKVENQHDVVSDGIGEKVIGNGVMQCEEDDVHQDSRQDVLNQSTH